jgi:hypothetical protein
MTTDDFPATVEIKIEKSKFSANEDDSVASHTNEIRQMKDNVFTIKFSQKISDQHESNFSVWAKPATVKLVDGDGELEDSTYTFEAGITGFVTDGQEQEAGYETILDCHYHQTHGS